MRIGGRTLGIRRVRAFGARRLHAVVRLGFLPRRIRMPDTTDAVRRPLALAHVILDWLWESHFSLEEQAAALDIAKRLHNLPRLGVMRITEIKAVLSSDVPTLNQSSNDIDHREDSQVLDSCQSLGN